MSAAEHRDLLSRVGSDVTSFDPQRVLAMPAATFVQSSPGVGWTMILLVALPLAVLEWMIGSFRAAVTFLLSDWISAPLTLLAIWTLARLGSSEAARLISDPDSGSSAAAHGTIAAVCMLLPGNARIVSLIALLAVDFAQFTFQRLDAALAHLLASLVGVRLGAAWLATTHPNSIRGKLRAFASTRTPEVN